MSSAVVRLASRRHLEFVFMRTQASHGPEQSWPDLRWLNTVLAVSEYRSFAKFWEEKGCSSQAETWQSEKYTDERV